MSKEEMFFLDNNKFSIYKSDITNEVYKKFGVYSGIVNPPYHHVCKNGEKMFSRFFYVTSGIFVFNQGTDDSVSATAGDIVYLPSNVSYVSDWVGSARGSYITLHFVLDEFYVKFPSYICIAKHDKDGLFLKAFDRMLTIWQQGKPGYELETLAQFYNFIYILYLDYMSVQLKEKHSKIYKGILYLENNYTDDVSISELAEMCYLSESTFRRLFFDYKKMPPITYRNYLRMKKAYTLIKTGEYTVTEAASAVNIPDLCYFNRLFKKYFGISPSKIM